MIFVSAACIMLLMTAASCSNKSYPCPGLGKSSAADLSMFDETGELKGKKGKKAKGGRIDKSTGMVNKKNPKSIRKKRKKRF
ncbi:MAG: hypothetical protein ACK4ND_08615 [Cytophagaceae bacterium]